MNESSSHRRACPSCQSRQLYVTTTGANGGYGPTLLPKLGAFMDSAKFELYLCGKCGHVAFFATEKCLGRLGATGNDKWRAVW